MIMKDNNRNGLDLFRLIATVQVFFAMSLPIQNCGRASFVAVRTCDPGNHSIYSDFCFPFPDVY